MRASALPSRGCTSELASAWADADIIAAPVPLASAHVAGRCKACKGNCWLSLERAAPRAAQGRVHVWSTSVQARFPPLHSVLYYTRVSRIHAPLPARGRFLLRKGRKVHGRCGALMAADLIHTFSKAPALARESPPSAGQADIFTGILPLECAPAPHSASSLPMYKSLRAHLHWDHKELEHSPAPRTAASPYAIAPCQCWKRRLHRVTIPVQAPPAPSPRVAPHSLPANAAPLPCRTAALPL